MRWNRVPFGKNAFIPNGLGVMHRLSRSVRAPVRGRSEKLIMVYARVGVGEPAREERVVLQSGDPAVPQPVGEASGRGGWWFFSIAHAGEEHVQEPVGEGLGLPDRREACP